MRAHPLDEGAAEGVQISGEGVVDEPQQRQRLLRVVGAVQGTERAPELRLCPIESHGSTLRKAAVHEHQCATQRQRERGRVSQVRHHSIDDSGRHCNWHVNGCFCGLGLQKKEMTHMKESGMDPVKRL